MMSDAVLERQLRARGDGHETFEGLIDRRLRIRRRRHEQHDRRREPNFHECLPHSRRSIQIPSARRKWVMSSYLGKAL